MLRSNRKWFAAALLCVGALATTTQAGVMDAHATQDGADRVFTTMTAGIPTPWEVYVQPIVTQPITERNVWFAEPGIGNNYNTVIFFGEINREGAPKAGHPDYAVWDRLVWFFKPGAGNLQSPPFMQILNTNDLVTQRPYWVVWDQLAWVPVPHVLWRQPIEMEGGEEPVWEWKRPRKETYGLATFLLPNSGPTAMPGLGEEPWRKPPSEIPLPTTAATWFLLLLLPPFRRPKRQRVPVTA